MILVDNLSFGYSAKKPLYKNLNLSLDSGKIYGLLGKNGAGKSTLLKNMIGLLFPSSGNISVNGYKPSQRLPHFLETIYFIPEEVYVPALTIKRYLNLFAPFYPAFSHAQFQDYLEKLDVTTDGKLNKLSFGQQKKFIIAFALACNTSTLLMDEPTNGLDIPSKKRFRKLIASVMNDSRTIFISTHQIRDLDNLIDQVIIIEEGELLLNASIETIENTFSFKTIEEIPEGLEVLYEEDNLNGKAIVTRRINQELSRVNLEHLFNAVTENPQLSRGLFIN